MSEEQKHDAAWDIADRIIGEAYPDFYEKGPGWWGAQRVANWGILRGAIVSAIMDLRAAPPAPVSRAGLTDEEILKIGREHFRPSYSQHAEPTFIAAVRDVLEHIPAPLNLGAEEAPVSRADAEREKEIVASAALEIAGLANKWADNEIHAYQMANEVGRILRGLRQSTLRNEGGSEPVAWMHTLDNTEGIEGNAPCVIFSSEPAHPFGIAGEDFSKTYPVTSAPLYAAPQPMAINEGGKCQTCKGFDHFCSVCSGTGANRINECSKGEPGVDRSVEGICPHCDGSGVEGGGKGEGVASDFDAWGANPYTKVLQKSIAEDYVPKEDAQPGAKTLADDAKHRMLRAAREHGMDLEGSPVAYEFYNPQTGHAIVDYTRWTYVGHLTEEAGYAARPLVYANAEQPSECSACVFAKNLHGGLCKRCYDAALAKGKP